MRLTLTKREMTEINHLAQRARGRTRHPAWVRSGAPVHGAARGVVRRRQRHWSSRSRAPSARRRTYPTRIADPRNRRSGRVAPSSLPARRHQDEGAPTARLWQPPLA